VCVGNSKSKAQVTTVEGAHRPADISGSQGLAGVLPKISKKENFSVQDEFQFTTHLNILFWLLASSDHCFWQASDSMCTTVLTVTLSKKKNRASRGFFVVMSNKKTNLKMIWKQTTNKQT